MAILNFCSPYKYFIGGIFFLFLQACTSFNRESVSIRMDSVNCHLNARAFYDNNPMNSFHYIHFRNDIYVCGKKNDSTLLLKNIFKDDSDNYITIQGKINSIGSRDSTLFVLSNRNTLTVLSISDLGLTRYQSVIKSLPPIFSDSLFIKRGTGTSIIPLDSNCLIVPYGAENNTPNYLDSNAYILINYSDPITSRPIVKTPNEYLSAYEYYTEPISCFSHENHCLYYTFNKKNYLYRLNSNKTTVDSVEIPNFKTTPYPADKVTSFTYIRKYLFLNDKNCKIVCGDKIIYLITRIHDKSYDVHLYSNDLKSLGLTNCKTHGLFPEMAFIKDNKLYVPSQKNILYCFSVDSRLQKTNQRTKIRELL
jgi:hypothetical protein